MNTQNNSVIPSIKVTQLEAPYLVEFQDDLGHIFQADEPTAAGGGNVAPSPERLMLASLGACTAITLRMYAARKGWALKNVKVDLQLNPQGKPAAGNDIHRIIQVEGDLLDEQRVQLMRIANLCPMHKLLTGEVRIATEEKTINTEK